MKKYIVNGLIVVVDIEFKDCKTRYRYPGDIISEKQYKNLDSMYKSSCSLYKKPPKPLKLYNLELHQWDSEKKISRHISTIIWSSPYQLCKWKKRIEESREPKPFESWSPNNGYYYKIVLNK